MPSRKRRSARRRSVDVTRSSTAPLQQTAAVEETGVASDYTPNGEPQAFEFACPLCGGNKGRANISTRTGEWVISCWTCSGSSYLFDLADALHVPGDGGYTLKEDPRKYLTPFITKGASRLSKPARLPSSDDIRAWHRMLRKDVDVMRYLELERGLSTAVIRRAGLGYDGRAITLPIHDVATRKLVNLRRRYWPNVPASGGKYQGLAGRTLDNGGVTVYPFLAPGSLILAGGEFDALVLQTNGLPGISVTSGAATRWRADWAWMVEGRRVAVMYDASPREEDQAISRAAELRREGAEDAWPVRLTETGLSDGEDVTDWFVKHGRSRADLLGLIRRERAASRTRRSR
jgi:hypothetical protein